MTATTEFVSPAEKALRDAKDRARVVAVLAHRYRTQTGRELNPLTRSRLMDQGARCAAVRPWAEVHADYRDECEGARRVLVCGGLVPWHGPELWAEAEADARTPRTRQQWLAYGLHVRRGAARTTGTDARGKAVDLYALDATEPEAIGAW